MNLRLRIPEHERAQIVDALISVVIFHAFVIVLLALPSLDHAIEQRVQQAEQRAEGRP